MSDLIASKDNAKIKEAYKALSGKDDFFLVEGFHLVGMALSHKAALEVFSLNDYECAVPCFRVTPDVIAKLTTTKTPEGIVALCRKKEVSEPLGDRLLYLDEINDPGNLGTLLRTALAFGWKEVVASKGSAEAYASKTLLASQGAIFALNFQESASAANKDIAWLKNRGYYLLATDLKAAVDLPDLLLPKDKKLALVLGNEARGVSPDVLALCDASVRLEMSGIDSLNVGVAGGILMYELGKKQS